MKSPEPAPIPPSPVTEVKYSLPELLAELAAERTSGERAMEKLDQREIGKLFKSKAQRRAKPQN